MIESIESLERRLLLAGVTATVANGTLTVQGTAKPDTIIIRQVRTTTNPATVTVMDGSKVIYNKTPTAGKFTKVVVYAGARNDTLTLTMDKGTAGVSLFGEGGNDTISASAVSSAGFDVWGQAGADTIYASATLMAGPQVNGGSGADAITTDTYRSEVNVHGDSGNDTITADGTVDTASATAPGRTLIYGGSGDDLVRGGALNDLILGGDGDDTLLGKAGNDELRGEDGDDLLVGGEGGDYLKGHAGNDIILGGNGADILYGSEDEDFLDGGSDSLADQLDGGDDDDVAVTNSPDVYTSIEEMI